jgi:2-hydroxy-3-oxopropionate reductase
LERLYAEGVDHGLSDLDQSGLFVELARRNGMK